MADRLLTRASPAHCVHGGAATPAQASPRVLVAGAPALTLDDAWVVAGCAAPAPCVTVRFVDAARRVTSGGRPLLLESSPAVCAPGGTPLILEAGQVRVAGV
jgi:hypothetical protein